MQTTVMSPLTTSVSLCVVVVMVIQASCLVVDDGANFTERFQSLAKESVHVSKQNTLRASYPPGHWSLWNTYRQTCLVVRDDGDSHATTDFDKVHPTPYNCYHGKCWCTKNTADCSNSKLTFIPKELPTDIRFLNFSNNGLVSIPDGFFDPVMNVTSLSLSNNNITHIHPAAFASLRRLRSLFLDHNAQLTHTTMMPVFTVKSLQCVDLRYGNLQALPDEMFTKEALPDLEEVYLHDNYIDTANLTKLQALTRLKILAWGENDVDHFYPGLLKDLHQLDLFSNSLAKFPETCDGESRPYFPALTILSLKKNKITFIPSLVCLPALEVLDLSGNFFPKLQTDMFGSFPTLGWIHLEQLDTHVKTIEPFAFRNPALRFISLMYNSIEFSEEDAYSLDSFSGCPNLTGLQLSHNYLNRVSDERFIGLFGHLTELTSLFLGGVSMEQITTSTFAGFPHMRILELYENRVPEVPDGAFANNPELVELQLNENRISVISESTFSPSSRERFTYLDLSGNPFVCDCGLRWFSDWLRSNSTALSHRWTTYNCTNLQALPLELFRLVNQACIISQTASIAIVVSCVLILALYLSVLFLFRYRFLLRLKLYEVFRGRGDLRRHRLETGHYDYDVFVSYCSLDESWVTRHLKPELEERFKLKLCVHERDFIPGRHIVDNIVTSIERSKKILMVFSKHFLASSWCQFELAVCLQHALDCDDDIIVACLGDVASSRDLTSSMKAVMTSFTYIEWEGARACSEGRARFWGRMRSALEEVVEMNGDLSAETALWESSRHSCNYGTFV